MSDTSSIAVSLPSGDGSPSSSDRIAKASWITLLLLTLTYSFSWMDRFLLIILIDPISRDLNVSNTEIGLLTGFGASLLYSLSGLAIAPLADRRSRSRIISLALGSWSALTAAIGFAGSFATLAISRFGIAIASAGCSPAAYSLISDLFPARRRGTAIAIYSLGISLGTWAGLTLGGLIADAYGWRNAFLAIGLPGALMAVILGFGLREPERGRFEVGKADVDQQFSAGESVRFFLNHSGFMGIALGFAFISCAASSFENWVPTYLIRAHGLSATEVGSVSGMFQGLTGIFGALLFGFISDRLARRDQRWYLWIPLLCAMTAAPLVILFFQLPKTGSYLCYFLIELCVSGYSAPLFAASQMLLPPRLRALGMATILFFLNVIGMGLGPFLAGYLSDFIGGTGKAGGLANAISLMQGAGLLGALALIHASRALRPAMRAAAAGV